MTTFPEFYLSLNSHMFLVQINEKKFEIFPPNQLDWKFTLIQLDENKWQVHGIRDLDFDEFVTLYTKNNGDWIPLN